MSIIKGFIIALFAWLQAHFILHYNSMLSPTEKTLLKELLALAPVPEQTLSYNELMGFMFGLAITPVIIPAEEWMVAIFGEDDSGISATDQARSMSTVLSQVYGTFLARKTQGELHFPYQMETLEEEGIEEVLEWVSGFEEALALCPDIWEPGDEDTPEPENLEELYFSMMVIQGLVDPVEIMPFFEKLPDEVFAEAFITFDPKEKNRELQIQAFLLATLPLSVKTLQDYADQLQQSSPIEEQEQLETNLRPTRFPDSFPVGQPTSEKKPAKKGNVIRVDFSKGKTHAKLKASAPIYQLKITLKNSKPPIWRRVLVPGFMNLDDLHEIIQLSMGWFDSHLHQFDIDSILYGPPIEDDWGMETIENEEEYSLQTLSGKLEPYFDYIYDFGDDWQHRITVEKVLPPEDAKPYPVIIKGKRACPPEDIGGIWGYQEFLEAYNNPDNDNHQAMQEWAGPDFESERFDKDDIDEINLALKDMFS